MLTEARKEQTSASRDGKTYIHVSTFNMVSSNTHKNTFKDQMTHPMITLGWCIGRVYVLDIYGYVSISINYCEKTDLMRCETILF